MPLDGGIWSLKGEIRLLKGDIRPLDRLEGFLSGLWTVV